MRVIAGIHRGRRLAAPAGQDTRPMPSLLRETLFSILGARAANKVFVDLYAGSGAVGLEALSRGARKVVFVESGRAAAETVEKNVRMLGAERSCSVLRAKTESVLARIEGDIYFLGPPYPLPEEYEKTFFILGAAAPELVIAQHAKTNDLAERYGNLRKFRTVQQGSNSLSFYENVEEPAETPTAPAR